MLRMVSDNAADRATVTASTTAGTLVPANLQTDLKSSVWRSTATSATLTLVWTAAELVSMACLAFSNLTSAATMRVRGYTLSGDASPAYDSTALPCAAGAATFPYLGANTAAYGGGVYGTLYFPQGSFQKVVIDVADTSPLGYVQAGRVIVGKWWSPTYDAEAGVGIDFVDNSKNERNDAGDLTTDRGTIFKKLSLDLNFLTTADRSTVMNIFRNNGMFKPVFMSLLPQDSDTAGEQAYTIYGRMSKVGSLKFQLLNMHATQLELEEL